MVGSTGTTGNTSRNTGNASGKIDFDTINSAALACYPSLLERWLPGGKQSGREYECGDISGGAGKSMKVNIDSGRWSDFAGAISGGDPISLFAAINGISQGDAAKQLGDDLSVAPISPRHRKPTEQKPKEKQKWTPLPVAPPDALPADFNHYKHGTPSRTWEYKNTDGALIGYVCRFDMPDGSKEIIPIAWCACDSAPQSWRWLSFGKPRPLYNLPSLALEGNVIIVEGEKCADALQPLASELSCPVISWPGGGKAVKHADWTPLAGRKCLIWPDHDDAGYSTAADISKTLGQLGCEIRTLTPPQDKPKGWDCVDWIAEPDTDNPTMNANDLIMFIREGVERQAQEDQQPGHSDEDAPPPDENPATTETTADEPPDRESFPFYFLGYDRGTFYYLSKYTKQVVELRAESHQGRALLPLAHLSWWERKFPGKNGINWEAAADTMIRISSSAGIFDPARIRGRGAWEDNGRSVLHTGGYLVVDGTQQQINNFETKYIYEVAQDMDQQISGRPLSSPDANKLKQICERLSWTKSINAALLAGWCVVAPICGAMRWRPHIWITGSKGTGKSWILENIIKPTVGGSALSVTSSTTEAGIRQTLNHDARPVVFDEAEGEDKGAQRRIQSVLELARQASSEASAAIFKGTATGRSMSFHIRSCFLFASIGVNITQDSDSSRITVLSLKPDNNAEKFESLRDDVFSLLTPEYCSALRSRSVSLIPIIRKNAEIFARAGAEYLGSQRTGDQIGALLAGYYSLFSNKEVSLSAARDWIKKQAHSWDEITEGNEESDEHRCLYAILGHVVKVQTRTKTLDMSLGELISISTYQKHDHVGRDEAENIVKNHGIRPDTILPKDYFIVSNTDQRIKKLLKDTPWANGWNQLLQRIEGAEKKSAVTFSAGVRTRGTVLPVTLLFDETKNHQTSFE